MQVQGHEIDAAAIVHLHGVSITQLAGAMRPARHRVTVSNHLRGVHEAPEEMYVAFGRLTGCGAAVDLLRQVVAANFEARRSAS